MKKRILVVVSVLVVYLLNSILAAAQINPVIPAKDNPFYVLVNKQKGLGKDYKPTHLVVPNVKFSEKGQAEKKHMQYTAAYYLKLMFNSAAKENINLVAVSGYRSYGRQNTIYNHYIKKFGQKETDRFSAKPGYSEHQTGLAMDVSAQSIGYSLTERFGNTKEGKWLASNAHKYGFIIRYPKGKEKITGYMYEPWHVRYVGEELAAYLYINHLAMEEMQTFFDKPKDIELIDSEHIVTPSESNGTQQEALSNPKTEGISEDSFKVVQE
ncbi:MAG: D-alanyl-D-alanine carboxypeptidase [Clostridia bacterium]|jgi:LAS superfamily LD-carboxypeptidase LdcB|nr:D-alanyl-D-alanine carboxypeptidase [Clostridia bacterium]